jgi:hypothetical protein
MKIGLISWMTSRDVSGMSREVGREESQDHVTKFMMAHEKSLHTPVYEI